MDNNDTQKAGYTVEKIILMEQQFHREMTIDFNNPTLRHDIDMVNEPGATVDNRFAVNLNLKLTALIDEQPVYSINTIFCGVFKKDGEPPLLEEDFKKINAPAIIYPFIREHIHSLCSKATLGNIMLPTVNFQVS
ncbi:MAG: protein-export chaperone SecB [Flavobacterium sp.]|nr:protein-export chaperone SecB [Flavobacterium sp.]